MMSVDMLESFGSLDELIQVIYQGIDRFVVLSNVSYEGWTIHLGLLGSEGRWWSGSWTPEHVLTLVGKGASDKLLESFANNLTQSFVSGELHIGDWSGSSNAEINLTFGLTAKRPMQMGLREIPPVEAASYATKVFLNIALQAQSRRCQLHGSSLPAPLPMPVSISATRPLTTSTAASASGDLKKKPFRRSSETRTDTSCSVAEPGPSKIAKVSHATKESPKTTSEQNAEDEIKSLKAELAKQKGKKASSPAETNKSAVASKRPPKGASLANPSKKARKFQAIEFESDEE